MLLDFTREAGTTLFSGRNNPEYSAYNLLYDMTNSIASECLKEFKCLNKTK